MSSTSRMPPPTVNGTKTCSRDVADGVEVDLALLRAGHDVVEDDLVDLVVVEPLRELGSAGATSMLSWNCCAFVTRPSMTSKQAMSRLVSTRRAVPRSAKFAQQREPELAALLGVELRGDDVVARRPPSRTRRCTRWCRARVGGVGRARVVASSRSRSGRWSGQPAATRVGAVNRTSFQPICGTRSVSGKRRTVPGHPAEAVGVALLAVVEQHLEPDADPEERARRRRRRGRSSAPTRSCSHERRDGGRGPRRRRGG